MEWFFSKDSKNMLLKWDCFQKFSLVFKRAWVAMKHPSLFLRQLITCWSVVAKFSAVFSMFAKPLTQSGLMAFFTNNFRNLVSEVVCSWPWHIYTQMSMHKFFYEGSLSRKIKLITGYRAGENFSSIYVQSVSFNGLLNVLSNHFHAIFVTGLRIPPPSFADDIP